MRKLRLGGRNHVVISVLCVVVTGSVGRSRRRDNWRVNGCCNSPSAGTTGTWSGMENEERRTKKIFEDGAAMTGQGKEKRQANDWRTFNEKSIKQAKTGLFIQNLCKTEHPGEYERTGIFILESRRDLGRLYEMAPVRIARACFIFLLSTLMTSKNYS